MRTIPSNDWCHSDEHCLHGSAQSGPSQLQQRLHEAENYCRQQGGRLTLQRQQVLELILQTDKPVGAYELMAQLGEKQGKPAAPPTVYRALEFLLEHGLIHRLSSLNAYVPCCHFRDTHEAVFLICEQCQRVQEASPQSVFAALQNLVEGGGFRPRTALIEMLGRCTNCQEIT